MKSPVLMLAMAACCLLFACAGWLTNDSPTTYADQPQIQQCSLIAEATPTIDEGPCLSCERPTPFAELMAQTAVNENLTLASIDNEIPPVDEVEAVPEVPAAEQTKQTQVHTTSFHHARGGGCRVFQADGRFRGRPAVRAGVAVYRVVTFLPRLIRARRCQ
jgi:hypothetical protein